MSRVTVGATPVYVSQTNLNIDERYAGLSSAECFD